MVTNYEWSYAWFINTKKINNIIGTYFDSFLFSGQFAGAMKQVIQQSYLHTPEGPERAVMVI